MWQFICLALNDRHLTEAMYHLIYLIQVVAQERGSPITAFLQAHPQVEEHFLHIKLDFLVEPVPCAHSSLQMMLDLHAELNWDQHLTQVPGLVVLLPLQEQVLADR